MKCDRKKMKKSYDNRKYNVITETNDAYEEPVWVTQRFGIIPSRVGDFKCRRVVPATALPSLLV